MSGREVIVPKRPHALYARHGYSPAIRSGDLLFVSGMVGARADGSPEPELGAQIELAFENLRAVLEAAGCTFEDVVDVTYFMVDAEASVELLVEAIQRAFPVDPPSLTAVGVTWLSGFEVELKAVARIPA